MKYNLKNSFKRKFAITRFKKLLDLDATIELKELKCKRSISANALYWLWLTCIENETGSDKYDLHEYFKLKYLGTEGVEIFGEIITKIKTTSTKDSAEFSMYMNHIKDFCLVNLRIDLPYPDHKYFKDFYLEYIK
ncbi:MAG: hypothetical protein GY679_00200 [Mycoplasma sp.]|nr:hypothetical protein [Mycoplasma sp.]